MDKKIIGYRELRRMFCAHEATHPTAHLTAHIVFTEDSFDKRYPLEGRTYIVSSDNKAFQPNKGGYSIFANCLDGTDPCVRLEAYMAVEHGGREGWRVDHCYLVDNPS